MTNKGETQNTRLPLLCMAQSMARLRSERSFSHPKIPFSRLLASLRLIFHPRTPLEVAHAPSHTASVPDQSMPPVPGVDRSLPIDPDALRDHLIDLVSHLPPLLPDSCKWLERGDLEVIGERPIDVGGVADVWAGMMGARKVAIKSYRYYSSSDYLPTFVVSGVCPVAYVLSD